MNNEGKQHLHINKHTESQHRASGMEHSYSRCVEKDEDEDEEERRRSSSSLVLLPPLLSNISASFDEGIVLLPSAEHNSSSIDDEGIHSAQEGTLLNNAADQRRRKRTNCASTAAIAGATILLLALASSSVRKSRSSNHPPTHATSDPCSVGTWSLEPQIDNRFYGGVGVMYLVAGSPAYAEQEFLPLIQYLRDGLLIPDAIIRAKGRKEKTMNATGVAQVKPAPMETRFALVTQPHLCRTVLQPMLSFFDVITVVDLDNVTSATAQTMDNEDVTTAEDGRRLSPTTNQGRNTDHKYRLPSIESQNMTKQQQRMVDLHRAKAVKVLSLARYAPFHQTVYLDLDMVPWQKNFAHALLRSAARGSIYIGHFDIALPYASHPNVNLPMPSVDKERHYYRRNVHSDDNLHDNEEGEELGGRGVNQHNSAAVILNMTSSTTWELLRRFEKDFFSSPELSGHWPTLDQPSLGRAMYSMFSENNTASLQHVDLNPEKVCRKGSRFERTKDNGLADISCGKSNDCILIHKPARRSYYM